MKTTSDARRTLMPFLGKAIVVMALPAIAAFATGCSDAAEPTAHTSCISAPLVAGDAPAVQVALKATVNETPDVTIRGAGFPAGARVSLAYVGLPGHDPGGATADFDFDDVAVIANDGTFAVTQHAVGSLEPCDAANAATGSIVVGANGMLAGASVPTSFWCANNAAERWGDVCE
ncbi:MAG: hypothetical protein ACRELY_23470 [Polyangiaceae bacterium]